MSDLNEIRITGRLVHDPLLRQTGTGLDLCTFTIASTRRGRGPGSSEETLFVGVTSWGNQARTCARRLAQGRYVHVRGCLQAGHEWDGKGAKIASIGAAKVKVLASRWRCELQDAEPVRNDLAPDGLEAGRVTHA